MLFPLPLRNKSLTEAFYLSRISDILDWSRAGFEELPAPIYCPTVGSMLADIV